MPPKAKITKEMILNTVLNLTRERGFETVNARSIACKLECSTRPLFTCYENMEQLKREFLLFLYDYYEQYVSHFQATAAERSYLILPLSYIAFAQEEPRLFQLLFIDDMDLSMTDEQDFYKEEDNQKKAEQFSKTFGIELEQAKILFLDLFLYTHGIAVLTATKKMSLNRERAQKMVTNMVTALIRQEKPDWSPLYENKPLCD